MPLSLPTITIIVPYFNKWTRTKYLLESLNYQEGAEGIFDVIIIDDGSDPPIGSFIKKTYLFPLQIIYQNNSGRSAARNSGLHMAKGEVVLFIDDDIILPPSFIRKHSEIHAKRKNVFVHNPIYDLPEYTLLSNPENGEYYDFLKIKTPGKSLGKRLSLNAVFDNREQFEKTGRMSRLEKLITEILLTEGTESLRWIGCVGGSISICRKTALKFGGFDMNFKVWGGEDFEFGYRLIKAGLEIVYDRDNRIYHITHAHKNPDSERNAGFDYFYQKHEDPFILELYQYIYNKSLKPKDFLERRISYESG
ncbi:MAG: glycosyltransferase family 2 protein [Lachnospiraceae bacterium]|nr:glycosyltransferase family 2 protein [Lachnospiraceae bacterium]